jgi:hypothetical protein
MRKEIYDNNLFFKVSIACSLNIAAKDVKAAHNQAMEHMKLLRGKREGAVGVFDTNTVFTYIAEI